MKAAPKPPNESERLELLRAFEVLDTEPEPIFDDITRVAAALCDVPIALVSLVDENRQWFKSRIGLAECETSREAAFCSHTVVKAETMIVEDAFEDDRFHDNPLVLGEPFIRFYAGAPLAARNGLVLGSLCVIDTVPRKLGTEQQAGLEALARVVVEGFEHRRMSAELVAALDQVRTLSDLLPMCAGCKKVRIDDSYWKRLEVYLLESVGTRVSHGLCPECVEVYFPGKTPKQD